MTVPAAEVAPHTQRTQRMVLVDSKRHGGGRSDASHSDSDRYGSRVVDIASAGGLTSVTTYANPTAHLRFVGSVILCLV